MAKWLKSSLWVAVFSILAACGSKPGNLRRIGGTVGGLTGTGLILQLNGGHDLAVAANATTFLFDTWIVEGAFYSVTLTTQPSNPVQNCTATANGTGTVGTVDVTNITVGCTTSTYTVGGSVTGLTGSDLVLQLDDHLQNSPQSLAVSGDTSGNASFTFPNPVVSGANYSVTVTTQPISPTEVCTVANGTGTVTGANITNLTVTCSTKSYFVGGSVTGLQGSGPLVLRLNGHSDLALTGNGVFTFTTPVASGAYYKVTVFIEPTNPLQTCTVANGTGTVDKDITSITVTCGKANGQLCSAETECLQGNCVDGVCCNSACVGPCQACNVTGSVGTCSDIPAGLDPENECVGAATCNGAGRCG